MREKGGSDTAVEIRTRPVVDGVPSRGTRDVREHSRGRRLSVRPGDACDAILKFGCEGADEVGVQGERNEARKRGRATAGRAEALAGELAGSVGDERERVRHD